MPTSKPEKKEPKKPLSATHPDLAKEANGWDPKTITAGSGKKVNWKCRKGHRYVSTIGSRTGQGSGCPYCIGKKILAGFNDLATTHPKLSGEAYKWDPTTLGFGSGKKVRWKCPEGHIWECSPNRRTSGSIAKCPVCINKIILPGFNDLATTRPDLAKETSKVIARSVWSGSLKKVSWKCSAGHIWEASPYSRSVQKNNCPVCGNKRVVPGINDLQTTNPILAKEADGWDPSTVTSGSSKRLAWKCKKGHKWSASPGSRSYYKSDCPFCIGHRIIKDETDLGTLFPEIAKEADGWDPSSIAPSSTSKLKWRCSLGHRYLMAVHNKALQKQNCPVCSGNQVLAGFNDLATINPEVAQQSFEWDPSTVTAGSKKKQKWKCQLGHIWEARILSRVHGAGCPTCAISGYDPNQDAFLYFLEHPKWEMLQIGITNFPHDRVSKHKNLGWEVLETRGPMDGHLTRQWETAILRMLKKKGADLSNEKIAGKFDGYSEAWTKATFPVGSIKELMRLTDEFEDGLGRGRRVE